MAGVRLVVALALVALIRGQSPCTFPSFWTVEWLPDPLDCRGYYVCAFFESTRLLCEDPNTVWQPEYKVCCLRGSPMDSCSQTAGQGQQPTSGSEVSTSPKCEPGMTGRLSHPTNCARYYDCSQPGRLLEMDEPSERECPHPLYFNPINGLCESHTVVNCNGKEMPIDACDYGMNACLKASCIPCEVRFPSCRGLPNGRNPWRGKGDKHWVRCQNQRAVGQGMCPEIDGVNYVFHTDLRVCVEDPSN